jgi:hypothetical protein
MRRVSNAGLTGRLVLKGPLETDGEMDAYTGLGPEGGPAVVLDAAARVRSNRTRAAEDRGSVQLDGDVVVRLEAGALAALEAAGRDLTTLSARATYRGRVYTGRITEVAHTDFSTLVGLATGDIDPSE